MITPEQFIEEHKKKYPNHFIDKKVCSNHTYHDTQIEDAENILECYDTLGFPALELEKSEEEINKERFK
jgi:hypothetical protein